MQKHEFDEIWEKVIAQHWNYGRNDAGILWSHKQQMLLDIPVSIFKAVAMELVVGGDKKPRLEDFVKPAYARHLDAVGSFRDRENPWWDLPRGFRELVRDFEEGQIDMVRLIEPREDRGPNFQIRGVGTDDHGRNYGLLVEDVGDRKKFVIKPDQAGLFETFESEELVKRKARIQARDEAARKRQKEIDQRLLASKKLAKGRHIPKPVLPKTVGQALENLPVPAAKSAEIPEEEIPFAATAAREGA